jgi:hypothetical protein
MNDDLWKEFLRQYPKADPVHHPKQAMYYAYMFFYYRNKRGQTVNTRA